jgi:hypothetical protein
LCLGQQIYETSPAAAVKFSELKTFEAVHAACEAAGGRILVFLAQASHKIKKKAEQLACDSSLPFLHDLRLTNCFNDSQLLMRSFRN